MGTISIAELEETTVELLPARETLNWFHINVANVEAVNVALALNFGDYGSATAVATQAIAVVQH